MMLSRKIPLSSTYKNKLFQYARTFDNIAYLDSQLNGSANSQNIDGIAKEKYSTEDTLIALGKKSFLSCNAGNAFKQLEQYTADDKWAFGFLSYDLKNEVEDNLSSNNFDGLNFPDLYFFEPEVIVRIQNNEVEVLSDNEVLLEKLCDESCWESEGASCKDIDVVKSRIEVKSRFSQSEYIDKVVAVKERISRGDVYEMNFCHEFYAENTVLDPFLLNEKLVQNSPTPFSSFFKVEEQYVMCASPERFLKKAGSKVISQPIKGTIKRGETVNADEELKLSLLNNPKERSENVMIVDLVRNDLSQIAKDGSVKVDELFGIYTFPQVHQMISTVSCQVKDNMSAAQLISKCFPMGSMTGAPKVKAMEIIEEVEETKRGLFSGSIGYITPTGDFDFNVLIRSLFYSADAKYLSFSVGGAITQGSDPEQEYEESLLKAKAIFEVLS